MRYELRPGERVNEQALGRELGVSRSPLREALNRLVAEGYFEFVANKGFYRKSISVDEVVDLYEVRSALERKAVALAIRVATDEEIGTLRDFWKSVMKRKSKMLSADMVLADEEFHRRLAGLSRNRELAEFLDLVTRRIHVARHIDVEQSDWNSRALSAHARLVEALAQRQFGQAEAILADHIDMSLKRAVGIAREMVARLYLGADHHGDPAAGVGSSPAR